MKRPFLLLLCLIILCGCGAKSHGDTGTPPNLMLEERYYCWTELSANTLPAGWVDGGIAEAGSYKGSHYFVRPEYPYWLYVDEDDTYRLLVDARIWHKDLLCYDGILYSRMDYDPNATGLNSRMKESEINGLILLGSTEFSGLYTVPTGALSSNFSSHEVHISPDYSDTLFIPTTWTWSGGTEQGYEVFVPWTIPN